ncbi:unnamed protein product [Paramecium primaurelia]|uniref:Uncharacterized protein n=1 Tax=Paramecium primaurelia TaxID=5886 RepID=A0A8S1PZU4_PARPR|nr:unnamed protein product [Paramecium primaurelia]
MQQQANTGYGIWMKYQPFRSIDDLRNRYTQEDNGLNYQKVVKGGQFIYSIEQGQSQQNIIVVSVYIDIESELIQHHVLYSTLLKQHKLQFTQDNQLYEGVWIMFFVFFDVNQKKTTFGYNNLKGMSQIQVVQEIPFLEQKIKHIQGGLYQYIDNQQTLVILDQFQGQLSYAFTSKFENIFDDINLCVNRFMRYFYCQEFDYVLTDWNQQMKGDIYIHQTTIELDVPKYVIHGWIKLNLIYQYNLETIIFRITINKDYNDDLNLGDQVALLKYYQSNIPAENGFELSTYSYQFPVKIRYQTQKDDKISDYGDQYSELFIQWHYIQYEFGSDNIGGQPIFSIYFPSIDKVRRFQWNKIIRHFTGAKLEIYLGGDDYTNFFMKGFISEMTFTIFCESAPIKNPPCHFTCFTCNGPTQFNCISCSETQFRYFSNIENSCICQDGYYENDVGICESLVISLPQILRQEVEIKCKLIGYNICNEDQIECTFGYFQIQNKCIQCPHYSEIMSIVHFTCFNCIISPQEFAKNLTCFQEASTYQYNQEYIYQIRLKNQNEISFYEISVGQDQNFELVLCINCVGKQLCKPGYFYTDNQCINCIEGCQTCLDINNCDQCYPNYYRDFENKCKSCQNCASCTAYRDDIYCVTCEEKQILVIATCLQCGRNCDQCDDYQYCNFCIGSPQDYYISLDGINCNVCNIDNCIYCFEYYFNNNQYFTTLDIKFSTFNSHFHQINVGCALCSKNYFYNQNTQQCELQIFDNNYNCEFAIINQSDFSKKCIRGSENAFAIQIQKCPGISFCLECINNYKDNDPFCIICQDGYYSHILTGQCSLCPNDCKSCIQQNKRYRDYWKWDIKAFYKFFLNGNNDHPFEDFASNSSEKEMEIICTSCHIGFIIDQFKCIQDCDKACQKCEIINGKSTCIKCKETSKSLLKSQSKDGICQLCPSNCVACLDRQESEIKKINPYFILTSQNVQQTRICFEISQKTLSNTHYHYDTFTQTVSTCNQNKQCYNRIIFKLNLFCDYSDYFEKMFSQNDIYFAKTNLPLDRFYDEYYLNFYESQQLYTYLNEIQVKYASYEFTLIQGYAEECLMKNNLNIYSTLLQNVFTLQKIDIEFLGKEYPTKLKIDSQINFSNFTSVTFTNIQFNFGENIFTFSDSTLINLYNLKLTLVLSFNNCIFITKNGLNKNYTLQINSNTPYSLIINNLILETFHIYSSNLFQFIAQMNGQKNYLFLKNLIIRNSFFFNSTLFKFIANIDNLNYNSNFSEVEVRDTIFLQSSFILSSSLLNFTTGTILIEKLRLNHFRMLLNSNFVQLPSVIYAKIEEVELENCQFLNYSKFYSSNIINIENSIVNNTKIIDSNLIINDVDYSRSQQALFESSRIQIKSCQFLNNEYNNHQQIILIKRYVEITNASLQIENLFMLNNRLTTKIQQNQISYHQSMIYIECQICLLQNIIISRGYGFPEFSILNSDILTIRNLTFQQDQRYFSKTLHTSIDCVKKFTIMDLYFIIFIGQYQIVNIESFNIINSLSFNNPYIIFQGYDIMKKSINESIIIQDSKFLNNQLIITDSNKNTALISIASSQQCSLYISNNDFLNNHLNEYFQDQTSISSATLYISLQQGLIQIKNCTFYKNLVTNSSDSIIYIKSTILNLQNLDFANNNIKNTSNLIKSIIFAENENLSSINFEAAFPIKSRSGNGYFIVKELIINNISINSSNSLQGGGFYIATQGMSKILISNSFFTKTQTQLQSSVFSNGGCLYIDASLSQFTFSLINSSIDTSFAKQDGGGIIIIPSEIYNEIQLINVKIKDCFSLNNSFLSFIPNKVENLLSTITFQNVDFYQTEEGLNMYLSLLEQLTNSQASQLANSNPLIFVKFSNFTLDNCNFYSTYMQFLVYLDSVDNIILTNIKVINSSTFNSPLFKINIRAEFSGFIRIQNLEFTNIIQNQKFEEGTCVLIKQTQENQLQCPEEPSKNSVTINEPDFTQNQLICNKILIFSNYQYNFSLFEIDQINSNQQLFVQNIQFLNIICETCQFGLMRILGFKQLVGSNMQFSYIYIKNSICGNSGCLSIIRSIDVSYFSRSLQDNNRLLNSLNYDNLESQMKQQLSIVKSVFINNTALLGGSLYLIDIETLIRECIFMNNSARVGGAIYYNSKEKQLLILETDITMNLADIAGGLFINSQYLQLTKDLDVYLANNNSTLYGNNIVEKPRSLTLSLNGGFSFLENKHFFRSETEMIEQIILHPYTTYGLSTPQVYLKLPSGQPIVAYEYFDYLTFNSIPYNYQFRIIALDKFKQQIKGLDNSYCYLKPQVFNISAQAEQLNIVFSLSFYNISFNQTTGDYNLDNLVIYFNPNYSEDLVLRLFISCNSVSVPIYNEEPPYLIDKTLESYKIFVDIQTFPCQIGEFLNYTSGGCVICDAYKNEYSVELEAKSCSYKDDSKINSIKSSMIELKSDYWRPYYYSNIIEYCYHLPQNCKGGWLPGDVSCQLGHIGALCEQCDLYNIRGDGQFSVSQEFHCGNCDQISYNILLTILISLWTILSVLLSVSSTVAMMKDFIRDIRLKAFGLSHSIKEASPAILIKIFTNYLQIIQAISTFKLEVPFNVLIIIQGFANPIGSMAYSLDCFIVSFANIQIIYFKLIWSLIMAVIYLMFFFLLLGTAVSIKLIRLDVSYISTPFIYLFIYLQPNLIGQIISLLSYRKISNENWIQGNVSYLYNTNSHQQWIYSLCFPLLFIISSFIPCCLWFGLFKNKHQLNNISIRRIWGYLYNEYKNNAYYWETLKIIEKEAIIIVLIYYNDHIQIKASIVFLILFYYSFLTNSSKPYATGQLNRLDAQSTIICAISIIMASCIYTAQQQRLNEIILPSYFVIGFINSLYLIQMILQIILSYFKKFDLLIDRFKEIILKNFPNIISQHPKIYNFLEGKKQKKLRVKIKYKKLKDYLLARARKNLQFKMLNENFLSNQGSLKGFEQEQNFILSPQIKSIQSEVVLNTSQLISERTNQIQKYPENQQKSIFYAFQRDNKQRLLKVENIQHQKPENSTQ